MFWQNYGRRSLWRELDRLQREMNRMMDSSLPAGRDNFPPLNVWANDERAMIMAEVPGVDPDALDISVVNDNVTISGERQLPHEGEHVKYHRHERWHGSFSRTMQMPFRINPEAVEATYRHGILGISLPRAEEDRPRQISVATSETA